MAVVLQTGHQIGIFDDPLPPDRDAAGGNRLSRDMEVLSTYDVHSVGRDEQSEAGSESRIRVEKFEGTVTFVVSVSDIEDALVSDSLHQRRGRRCDRRAWKAYAKRGHSRVHRRLMNFSSGYAEEAVRIVVEISIEHPYRGICTGNVF